MEIKKSEIANLEDKRVTGFLLGLVLVLALLFVGFEYTSHDKEAGDEDNEENLNDMAQDIEMMPAMDQKDMIAAVQAPSSQSITQNVKAVNETSDEPDKLSPNSNPLMVGNGEGATEESNVTQALPQTPVDPNDMENVRIVEQLPEFPGGMVEFMKWLTHNLKYPPMAQRQKIEGEVVVSFIVNKDGSIADVKIQKSVDPSLDREALRVVRMMPQWKPGIENNKPCRTMFAIPINFKI
jgi:protein TonB